jgi:hypothetical protein
MNLYVKLSFFLKFYGFFFQLASSASYSTKMNPNGIFPNNELDLQKIKVYGFDFGLYNFIYQRRKKKYFFFYIDYTLARYKPTLHTLIYDHAKTFLVKNFRVRLMIISFKRKENKFFFESIQMI